MKTASLIPTAPGNGKAETDTYKIAWVVINLNKEAPSKSNAK